MSYQKAKRRDFGIKIGVFKRENKELPLSVVTQFERVESSIFSQKHK
ncbi:MULTISPECIES: hypothetical protein [unclassified Helicobacter]|nr:MULTISPECIES: hypothetical protein [unclassified Helicobacter]